MYIAPSKKNPEVQFVKVKLCPVCGDAPHREECDLGRPGGHGYPGHKTFQYKCECCGLVKGTEVTDIYESTEEAIHRAKVEWNVEVERIVNYLRNQWVPRHQPEEEDD